MTTEQMDTTDETRRRENARPGSLVPQTFEEAIRLSEHLAKSELVPLEFRGKPANIFVALQLGADLGLTPMQALQSIAVFNGKPTLYGDVGLALAYRSPHLESFKEWFDEATQTAHCMAKRRGEEYEAIERTFGKADAERIHVYEKSKDKWVPLAERVTYRNFPRRMFQMRARWWALRDTVPDVFKGIVGREELEDVTDEPQIQDRGPALRVDEPEPPNPFMPQETAGEAQDEATQATQDAAGGIAGRNPEEPATASSIPSRTGAEPPVLADPEKESASPAVPTNPERSTAFQLNGQNFATAGVTKDQMLTLFKLCPQVNRKKGKGYDKDLLQREFGLVTRSDLTSETAERYRVRLTEVLEG